MYCNICLIFSGNHDYSSLSTSLTFLPGDTIDSPLHCVEINILDDDIVENEEEFTITVSSGSVIQAINVTSINVTIYEDTSDGKYILCVASSPGSLIFSMFHEKSRE